jgi:hypothetical protein
MGSRTSVRVENKTPNVTVEAGPEFTSVRRFEPPPKLFILDNHH